MSVHLNLPCSARFNFHSFLANKSQPIQFYPIDFDSSSWKFKVEKKSDFIYPSRIGWRPVNDSRMLHSEYLRQVITFELSIGLKPQHLTTINHRMVSFSCYCLLGSTLPSSNDSRLPQQASH